jgi:hypothetical protein
MLALLVISSLFIVGFGIGFWSLNYYPKLRPFRYSAGTEVPLPEPRRTQLMAVLAQRYSLETETRHCRLDSERLDVLLRWTLNCWEPKAGHSSGSRNPLDILSRVSHGEQFGPSDFVTVLSHALQATGIPTRLVELHARDSHWRPLGGYYTGLEAYLSEKNQWVWVDAQYDAIILNQGRYCSALDIKDALLSRTHQLELISAVEGTNIDSYLAYLAPFLDIVIGQPLGQNRRFALIPPQLGFMRRYHALGRNLYDQVCHSRDTFYSALELKQLLPTRQTKDNAGQRTANA